MMYISSNRNATAAPRGIKRLEGRDSRGDNAVGLPPPHSPTVSFAAAVSDSEAARQSSSPALSDDVGGGRLGAKIAIAEAAEAAAASSLQSPAAFTPREEELEWASVTPAEMLEIESDLRGLNLSMGGKCRGEGRGAAAAAVGGAASSVRVPGASVRQFANSGRGAIAPCCAQGGVGLLGAAGGCPVTTRAMTNTRDDDVDNDDKGVAMLPALEAEIDALDESEKGAYLEARRRCPDLVGDEQKKAFLFREDFDAKLAAKRMAAHWKYRLDLFGPERCFLPMTLAGGAMSGNDLVALSEGFVQLLPTKDVNGRPVLFIEISRLYTQNSSRESSVRAFWYLLHIIGSDPTDRRRGVVIIVHPPQGRFEPARFDLTLKRAYKDILTRCAVTVGRSFHVCSPDYLFHIINPLVKLVLGEALRKRYRVHYNSADGGDVLESMAEYGLTADGLPEEIGGEVRLDPIKWLSQRMIVESAGVASVGHDGGPTQDGTSACYDAQPASLNIRNLALPNTEKGSSCTPPLVSALDSSDSLEEPPNEVSAMMAMRRMQARKGHERGSSAEKGRVAEQQGPVKRKVKEAGGDPRMNRAVDAIMADPKLSQYDALVLGGFRFMEETASPADVTKNKDGKKKLTDKQRFDADNICLHQRKSQLRRRLRERRKDDPRMVRAVAALSEKPGMSVVDALLAGGFAFPKLGETDMCDRNIRDEDNVTLFSRKRQLTNKLAEMRGASVTVSS